MQNNYEVFERLYSLLTLQGQEFDNGSQRKALLYAAANGIGCVKGFFDEIFAELFYETMSEFGITQYSRILGVWRFEETDEQRRLVKELMAKGVECYQRGGLENRLAEISEGLGVAFDLGSMQLYGAGISDTKAFRDMCSVINEYAIPSTKISQNGNGLTFEQWDSSALSFEAYEEFNCPFAISDTM